MNYFIFVHITPSFHSINFDKIGEKACKKGGALDVSALLTLKEVAELEKISYEALKKQVQRGTIEVIRVPTNTRQGFEFRRSLSDLSEKAQARYYASLNQETSIELYEQNESAPEKYEQSLDELTGKQRDEIAFWRKAIDDWRKYISQFPKQKTAKTKEFISVFNTMNPERAISERTLRHKYKLFKEHGEIALADHRMNRKDRGTTTINDTLWSVFLQWWLDENQPTTAYIYKLVRSWAELEMPQLLPVPSYDAFYRATKNIPLGVIKFFREGDKVATDECFPYIKRLYDGIDSNDIWTADYHTLDIFVRDDISGKIFRPHVVVWLDVRSRKVLSMSLCESSNSDGVITSFKKAVKPYGLPSEVYLDNGREFLVRDFGGRGKRKTDSKADYGTTMLNRLNIEMTNARVRNGRAKVIERAFKQFTEEFSRLYLTYTGGRPHKRPERHNDIMKDVKNIPLRSEVERDLWKYIEGIYNEEESKAEGLNGMSPNQCYAQNLFKKRTATEEQLDSIMLRTSRLQKVNRNGVYLRFGERKIWFYDTDLVHNYLGHRVFVCYDSEDLSRVIIRDEQERRVGTATMLEVGGYNKEMDKEAIKKVKSYEKAQRNLIDDYVQNHSLDIEVPSAHEMLMKKAQHNIKNSQHNYDAKVIEIFNFTEKINQTAVGGEDDLADVDFDRMIGNGKRRGKK